MKKEEERAVYDETLRVEAYGFLGTNRSFPNHFHEQHYVIGLIEKGSRKFFCKNREYTVGAGDILLLHPGENHGCVSCSEETQDYRGFHISKSVMLDLTEEVTGTRKLPGFRENVIHHEEAACYLKALHEMVMKRTGEFEKEELLLVLLSLLIETYGQAFRCGIPECREEIERACRFMEEHFAERIYLEEICRVAGLSKSALLRAFTRAKGMTPYRYLEAIRVDKAKELLEKGMPPVDVAMETGFSDQSHFTNYFHNFIGLAPGMYREIFLEDKK